MNEITPKQKAQELFDRFYKHAYPFSSGSGFLSGEMDPEAQKAHAKEIIREIIDVIQDSITNAHYDSGNSVDHKTRMFWINVNTELDAIKGPSKTNQDEENNGGGKLGDQ